MSQVSKVLWHTTEGSGWPTYEDSNGLKGAKAPNLTYHPVAHRWHQHFPLNRSARALQDPSNTPVRENRDDVVQVEIIASADSKYAGPGGLLYVAELDDQAVNDLAEFAAFMREHYEVPYTKAPIWLPYPASYGNSKARMSSATYDAFKGHLGHMHASGNDHGDPGLLPINRILAIAAEQGKDDDVALTDAERQDLGKARWLADAWAQNGDFDTKLDKAGWLADSFASDGHLTLLLNKIADGNAAITAELGSIGTRLTAIEAAEASFEARITALENPPVDPA
jgi:hypothetical protein